MDHFYNIIAGNRLPDMGKSWKPLIPYHRERYLTPETLKQSVLNGRRISEICKELSGGDEKKEAEIKKSANAMLQEIGFTRNMAIIRFLGIILNKTLKQTTSGIFVNKKSLRMVKSILGKGQTPVLYLPSHRSYADFVLMSYICFVHNLEIPAIAAGMDFHAMVGMGTLLRATGAFFMRRSFSATDSLYWDVFKEYIRSIVTEYHTGMEFFVEGTRSRSCKALPPKIGLLSMSLEPLFARQVFDMSIVPVGVAYEKPLEEQLFAYELLGVPKPKESTKGLFKAMETLEVNHGNIYINFGAPLSVAEYLFNRSRTIFHSSLHERVVLTKDRLKEVRALSYKVVDEQQKLIVITTFNLIVVYFTYRSYLNKYVDLCDLKEGITVLTQFFKQFGALLATEHNENFDTTIHKSLAIHANILQISQSNDKHLEVVKGGSVTATKRSDISKLKGHDLAANTMRCSIPSIVLQLYTNPCLFWLHQPAFFVLAEKMLQQQGVACDSNKIFDEVKKLKNIFNMEFIMSKDNADEELYKLQTLLQSSAIFGNLDFKNLLLSVIAPFVLCYFNVADVILTKLTNGNKSPSNDPFLFTEKELFVSVQTVVEMRLNGHQHQSLVHPYCLSLDSIGNALQSFVAQNFIGKINVIKDKHQQQSPPIVMYSVNDVVKLESLRNCLLKYCSMFNHFNILSNYLCLAKM